MWLGYDNTRVHFEIIWKIPSQFFVGEPRHLKNKQTNKKNTDKTLLFSNYTIIITIKYFN